MKVLSLHQPWASLISCGVKSIETRSWSTKYRGRLAIHAAARKPDVEMLEDGLAGDELWGQWYETPADDWYPPVPPPEMRWSLALAPEYAPVPMPLGAIVATCTLADCAPMLDLLTGEPSDLSGYSPALYIEPDGLTLSHHFEVPARHLDVTNQLPYGDFRPGRFAWLLADIVPLAEPVPFKGGQALTKEWAP